MENNVLNREDIKDTDKELNIVAKKSDEIKISENHMKIIFDSKSENEALARVAVASFVTKLDPTLEEINDIKTAVSEAVTNCIIHGYCNKPGKIVMKCSLKVKTLKKKEDTYTTTGMLTILIKDGGVGIENVEQAMEPLYTSKPELDRAGMGFAFMQLFMDEVDVWSKPGIGTEIIMTKELKRTKKQV